MRTQNGGVVLGTRDPEDLHSLASKAFMPSEGDMPGTPDTLKSGLEWWDQRALIGDEMVKYPSPPKIRRILAGTSHLQSHADTSSAQGSCDWTPSFHQRSPCQPSKDLSRDSELIQGPLAQSILGLLSKPS